MSAQSAVQSIVSSYLKNQPVATPTEPKKPNSRVRFERRFGEDITNSNLLSELKEKAAAKKTKVVRRTVGQRSLKK